MKNIILSLLFLFVFLPTNLSFLFGDIVYLTNYEYGIPVKSYELGNNYILVTLDKNSLKSMNIDYTSANNYPDIISLIDAVNIHCKVTDVLDESILVRLARENVRSVLLELQKPGVSGNQNRFRNEQQRRPPVAAPVRQTQQYRRQPEPRQNEYRDTNRNYRDDNDDLGLILLDEPESEYNNQNKPVRQFSAKEDLKSQLLSEIQNSKSQDQNSFYNNNNQNNDIDLLEKTLSDSSAAPSSSFSNNANNEFSNNESRQNLQTGDFGIVKGQFIQSGQPLSSCKVRLIKLRKEGLVYYKDTDNEEKLEAVTDRNGTYFFNYVSPGFYKLYWKPPLETSWIRRVSMEPDALVKSGDVSNLGEIETNQRILN